MNVDDERLLAVFVLACFLAGYLLMVPVNS